MAGRVNGREHPFAGPGSKPPPLVCEVCNKEEALGVASVPGIPYSAAYCKHCIEANAHPYMMLVAGTSILGGLTNAHDWWCSMVYDTLRHLDISMQDFVVDVDEIIFLEDHNIPPTYWGVFTAMKAGYTAA